MPEVAVEEERSMELRLGPRQGAGPIFVSAGCPPVPGIEGSSKPPSEHGILSLWCLFRMDALPRVSMKGCTPGCLGPRPGSRIAGAAVDRSEALASDGALFREPNLVEGTCQAPSSLSSAGPAGLKDRFPHERVNASKNMDVTAKHYALLRCRPVAGRVTQGRVGGVPRS